MIDHQILLKKYMRIIAFREGMDYIPSEPTAYEDLGPPLLFTAEELAELERLSGENLSEINASHRDLK